MKTFISGSTALLLLGATHQMHAECCIECCKKNPTPHVETKTTLTPACDLAPCPDPCTHPCFIALDCPWGITLNGEFLYWYANESNLSYAVEVQGQGFEIESGFPSTLYSATSYKFFDTDWKPGYRVGLGYTSECSGWDAYLSYTSFNSSLSDSSSVPLFTFNFPEAGDKALVNPWVNGFAKISLPNTLVTGVAEAFPLTFEQVTAKWKLRWNVADFEVGKKLWFCDSFSFRPFAGVRGAWWDTRFQTVSLQSILPDPDLGLTTTFAWNYLDKFRTKAWGVGLIGGLQPSWYFCSGLSLYSNLATSLIWGNFKSKKREHYLYSNTDSSGVVLNGYDYEQSSSGSQFEMTPMLDLAAGLQWEQTWCGCFRTALSAGWEHHVVFNQNYRFKSSSPAATLSSTVNSASFASGALDYTSEESNLSLGGLVVRLQIDF